MLARILALFQQRPVEAPQAPAEGNGAANMHGKPLTIMDSATNMHGAGEGAATSPAVPVFAVGDALPGLDTLKAAAAGLTPRDIARLAGVHPDLVRVVIRARAGEVFTVIEGVRSQDRQAALVAKGASQTMRSRHLTGHAVDLGPVPLDWEDLPAFRRLASVMQRAADDEGVALVWGGTFRDRAGKAWFDGPHFELCRRKYP
jgi:peptidoglycan L-alanyl-D-glutamate endopeptidase CwlK